MIAANPYTAEPILETPRCAEAQLESTPRWRPMRLAYLTTQYPKVSHTFIRRELRELEQRGHHVLRLAIRRADSTIVDPSDHEEAARTLHCLSQPIWRLLLGQAKTVLTRPGAFLRALCMAVRMGRRSERGLLKHFAYLAEAAFLLQVVKRHHVEHLHVHFGTNAAAVARLLRCLGGPPYSFTVHGPDEFDAPRSWRLAEKQADAAFVVAITDYCAAQLRRWAAPADWPKIQVVRCGVDRRFLGKNLPIDPESRRLVCVGRLCPQKGQLLLVEALCALVQRGFTPTLVLAGDGEMRPAIEKRIAELGLAEYVEITGWIGEEQVRREIQNSRALVLPSFAEGLPVVIMEAMALARPVISTYVAGIPELVQPGKTGWLVPAGSVEKLTEAMAQVLSCSADVLDDMGLAGLARVRVLHNTCDEAARLEGLLLKSLNVQA